MRVILLILKLVLAAACLVAAAMVRMPSVVGPGQWLLIGTLAVTGILVAASLRWRRWSAARWIDRADLAPFTLAAVALLLALSLEARFQHARWTVLHADPATLEELGQHVLVGYRDPAVARELVERRAVGGLFITQRNVINRDAASVAREIAELQAIRVRQGLPPLWIATDQEGGGISRLSPPLPRQPMLASLVKQSDDAAQRRTAVARYATEQGKGLAALGVNLNFAPVVDLDFGLRNPDDAYTRITERAIAADPATVSEVAGWYCDALAAQGVRCTLKHFPGLGRVFDDTHRSEGKLNASLDELARADWLPFRTLLGHSSDVVMVGHVRLPALDPSQPASTSRQVVKGLLRDRWKYDGLVITDDMCMGPIYFGEGGIGQAAIRALNAGVDLLLLSWDGDQIFPVLAALLKARDSLDAPTLRQSADRLRAFERSGGTPLIAQQPADLPERRHVAPQRDDQP